MRMAPPPAAVAPLIGQRGRVDLELHPRPPRRPVPVHGEGDGRVPDHRDVLGLLLAGFKSYRTGPKVEPTTGC